MNKHLLYSLRVSISVFHVYTLNYLFKVSTRQLTYPSKNTFSDGDSLFTILEISRITWWTMSHNVIIVTSTVKCWRRSERILFVRDWPFADRSSPRTKQFQAHALCINNNREVVTSEWLLIGRVLIKGHPARRLEWIMGKVLCKRENGLNSITRQPE